MRDCRVGVPGVKFAWPRMSQTAARGCQIDGNQAGFALLLVLWVLALISLLITGVIVGANQYVKATSYMVAGANAEAVADASVMMIRLAIAQSLSEQQSRSSGALPGPVLCSFPEGELVVLSLVRDEDRISLNTDTVETIAAILLFAGAGRVEAERLALAITESRTIQTAEDQVMPSRDGATVVPMRRGPFATVMELEQIEGMETSLFRAVVPYLSVSNRAPTDNVESVISRGLAGPRPLVSPLADIAAELRSTHVLVHAEVLGKDGGLFVREAELSISAGEDPVSVREWRQGFARYEKVLAGAQLMRANHGMTFPGCYDYHE